VLTTGSTEISCFGLPLLYTESPRADTAALFRAQRLIRTEVEGLLQTLPAETVIRYKDSLKGGYLSLLGRTLLDRGAEVTPSFSQIIDLTLSEESLHKRVTKAYKWAVNWSKKNLSIQVIDQGSITFEHVEQFRLLHSEAAGRETRTRASWALQYDMVCAGEAFCVFAYLKGVLVSAALFPYSKSHCFYGVSASRRDLFDKPLSHGVIWSALMHAKQLSIRSFEMGEQLFPMTPRLNPSHKELGISFFKRAFGGEAKISLDIRLCTSPNISVIRP
jgi:lipid II:glycine glycyltransferase (peptidoglycan interpeptide bridge formation enzyme)